MLFRSGVLSLRELDARTAQGRLMGDLALDGRGATALWKAELRWDGVRLERWIHQARANGEPPYVSAVFIISSPSCRAMAQSHFLQHRGR